MPANRIKTAQSDPVSDSERDRIGMLLEEHRPLAASMARKACANRKMSPRWLESVLDEFTGHALYGLWQAARRFDPTGPVSFGRYAASSAYGMIIDESHKNVGYSRLAMRTARRVRAFQDEFMATEGRQPTPDEHPPHLRKAIKTALDAYHRVTCELPDEASDDGSVRSITCWPDRTAEHDEAARALLKGLSAKDAYMVWAHVVEDKGYAEIGRTLRMPMSSVAARLTKVILPALRRQLTGRPTQVA